ncbi:DoxX family protein [Spirillospora sp. NPDC047279]|uniref:DoxX family protein n=1 Tax=Spirillospora sp. NPDC047279 TaxID=3155478 RepID=UPI0034024E63
MTTQTTHGTATATAAKSSGRKAHIALWALQVLMALVFLMASSTKFSGNEQAVEGFEKIGFGSWFMYFIATVELAGAAGLLIPALCGLAATGLTALLAGAVVTQLIVDDPATAVVPATYLVPIAFLAWARRADTARLARRVAGQVRETQ